MGSDFGPKNGLYKKIRGKKELKDKIPVKKWYWYLYFSFEIYKRFSKNK